MKSEACNPPEFPIKAIERGAKFPENRED